MLKNRCSTCRTAVGGRELVPEPGDGGTVREAADRPGSDGLAQFLHPGDRLGSTAEVEYRAGDGAGAGRERQQPGVCGQHQEHHGSRGRPDRY
ncbi:unnamed protein product, partial [Darwinula stevensoni]